MNREGTVHSTRGTLHKVQAIAGGEYNYIASIDEYEYVGPGLGTHDKTTGTDGLVDKYRAKIHSVSDYYPYGMLMPGRNKQSEEYRYGFNGAERDDEVHGEGNSYDLGLRQYDPRLGRMKSLDPRTPEYPWQSPFVYHKNSPIAVIDYLGGGDNDYGTPEEAEAARQEAIREYGEKRVGEIYQDGNEWGFEVTNQEHTDISEVVVSEETPVTPYSVTVTASRTTAIFDNMDKLEFDRQYTSVKTINEINKQREAEWAQLKYDMQNEPLVYDEHYLTRKKVYDMYQQELAHQKILDLQSKPLVVVSEPEPIQWDPTLEAWNKGLAVSASPISFLGEASFHVASKQEFVYGTFHKAANVMSAENRAFAITTSKIFAAAGMATGILSTGYSYYKVVRRYQNGEGVWNMDLLDATIGTVMVASSAYSLYLTVTASNAYNPIGWVVGVGGGIYFIVRAATGE